MMPARIGAEELAVEHVRQPGDRVVVGDVRAEERPDQAVAGQARWTTGLSTT